MIKKTDINKIFPCQIPQFKLSCWGCCGRNFKSKKEIKRDIRINTDEFQKIKTPSTLRLLQFRDRYDKDPLVLTPSGLCSNLVDFGNKCLACPLHSQINEIVPKEKFLSFHKKDLRLNYCDVNFECETMVLWKQLPQNQKELYLSWLEKQDLDNYEYSIGNIEGKHIIKFLDEIYAILK